MLERQVQHRDWLVAGLLGPVGLLLLCLSITGCFNGEALVAQARANASSTLREEVDLGKYTVTLPRPVDASTTVTLKMHVFANVAKRDVPKIEEQLEERKYLLRHKTIMKLRQAAPEDLADPALTTLRSSVADVTKQILSAAPIDSIGFYRFEVLEQ